MPGKTAAPHEIPYAEQGDKPPSLEAATKPMAERVHKRLNEIAPSQLVTAGAGDEAKILVVQNTGAAAFKALSGDVTINAAGVAEIGAGKVGTTELADKGITTGKVNDKAITLGKLAEALGLTEGYYADASVTSRKAKLTAGVVAASENLALTTSFQDVPGTTLVLEPAVDSKLVVTAQFRGLDGNPTIICGMKLNSAADVDPGIWIEDSGGVSKIVPFFHALELKGGESHTFRLRAKAASTPQSLLAAGTRYTYELFAA